MPEKNFGIYNAASNIFVDIDNDIIPGEAKPSGKVRSYIKDIVREVLREEGLLSSQASIDHFIDQINNLEEK